MVMVVESGRRQRKRQAVHDAVLEAAEGLFRENGIARTTVDDIAETADVARQTVFNHFPYKEAIVLELGAESVEKISHQARAALESGVPALEVLERTASWILDAALEDPEVSVIVARELMQTDRDRAAYAHEKVPLNVIFEAILAQAWEEGSLRDDLPVGEVAGRISMILTGIVTQIQTCDAQDLRREFSICFDVLFNGIMDRRN